jgi:hypothetical protein
VQRGKSPYFLGDIMKLGGACWAGESAKQGGVEDNVVESVVPMMTSDLLDLFGRGLV